MSNFQTAIDEILSNSRGARGRANRILREEDPEIQDDQETKDPLENNAILAATITSFMIQDKLASQLGKFLGKLARKIAKNNDIELESLTGKPEVYSHIKEKVMTTLQDVENEDQFREGFDIGLLQKDDIETSPVPREDFGSLPVGPSTVGSLPGGDSGTLSAGGVESRQRRQQVVKESVAEVPAEILVRGRKIAPKTGWR